MNEFITGYLQKIIPVSFNLETAEEFITIGDADPAFTLKINRNIPKRELLNSTSLALGEAYMREDIDVDKDLFEVLDSFLGEMGKFSVNRGALRRILYTSKNMRSQEKEVTSHYDIGNDFYKLWLDETMSYSCGFFKEDSDTLYEAQVNKVEHILDKIHLKEGMTILDIGCGWGFLLKHAVKHYGVRGVGITLSREQHAKFQKDIEDEELQDRLEVRLMDYRELKASGLAFDRVVSVGMLEHVGRGNYPLFLECVQSVLKPGGLFLLHYISALQEFPGDAFIKKYIFPGGVIPSLREIIHIMGDRKLYTVDVESLRRHYTKTLLCWRDNLLKHKEEITKRYGKEFMRMWELYLASCAATFHNGIIDLHQIVMTNGINNELPMTRVV